MPVFGWSKPTQVSGKPMELAAMDDDLVVRTAAGPRTRPQERHRQPEEDRT